MISYAVKFFFFSGEGIGLDLVCVEFLFCFVLEREGGAGIEDVAISL